MTCILSLLTEDYVMQVSDRRLSRPGLALSEPLVIDSDEANKALFLGDRFTFGFTGLARFKLRTTDTGLDRFRERPAEACLARLWARDMENPTDAGARFRRCADLLTQEFEHVKRPGDQKRLAYFGVGWTANGSAELRPIAIAISNFHSSSGWSDVANGQFSIPYTVKDGRTACWIGHAGVAIPSGSWRPFSRHIRQLVKHGCTPSLVAAALVQFLHHVADNRQDVGRRALITCIPKRAVSPVYGGDALFENCQPRLGARSFWYVDGPDAGWPQLGPIVATRGWVMSGFKATGPGAGVIVRMG